MTLVLSQTDIAAAAIKCAARIERHPSLQPLRMLRIFGVPRGGIPAAYLVASFLPGRSVVHVDSADKADLIIDDLVDSGATRDRYDNMHPTVPFFTLFNKKTDLDLKDEWLVFPWERSHTEDNDTDIVTRLLQYIGEDPSREGLRETPTRVLKAWREWATGYQQDPAEILKCFEDGAEGCNSLVIVHNIPFIGKCEHHLADVTGVAHVGYIPDGKIVGLSKLARLVDVYARRLQVQERATNQIADALIKNLSPIGVGVLIRASHACMSSRGVKIHGSTTTTSAMRGALLNEAAARQEFFSLCDMAERSR